MTVKVCILGEFGQGTKAADQWRIYDFIRGGGATVCWPLVLTQRGGHFPNFFYGEKLKIFAKGGAMAQWPP